MSLYSALYAGVSGLSAESAAMAAVADNIININTIGYKGTDTQFSTLVTDGRSRTTYSAGGVSARPQALISKQGLLQASGNTTDLGIEGGGFFVTRTGLGSQDTVAFTRAGSFKPDTAGFLRNTAGFYLQGWRLDNSGAFENTGNVAALEPIRLNDLTGTAMATNSVELRANLQSSAVAVAGPVTRGDIAAGTLAPQFTRAIDVYDAQCGTHRVTMGFVKTGPNAWHGEIYADPAEVTAPGGVLASGEIRFNPDGSIINDSAVYTSEMFGPLTPNWTNGAAADPIALVIGSNGALSGLTQFGSESALITSSVNGGMLGNISSVQVSDAGIVSAVFENGIARKVFQLPVATFPNADGLTRTSGNAFLMSDASGNYAINRPGALGAGTIRASTLEASTVDLAQEFSNMIRFQRAYSASSKIITTVDDMLQEVSNLKR